MAFGPAARGDGKDPVTTEHLCDAMTTCEGRSGNVLINNIGVHRKTDLNTIHDLVCGPSCCPHQVALGVASGTVFANNLGVGRKADTYPADGFISDGSPDVNAGD